MLDKMGHFYSFNKSEHFHINNFLINGEAWGVEHRFYKLCLNRNEHLFYKNVSNRRERFIHLYVINELRNMFNSITRKTTNDEAQSGTHAPKEQNNNRSQPSLSWDKQTLWACRGTISCKDNKLQMIGSRTGKWIYEIQGRPSVWELKNNDDK